MESGIVSVADCASEQSGDEDYCYKDDDGKEYYRHVRENGEEYFVDDEGDELVPDEVVDELEEGTEDLGEVAEDLEGHEGGEEPPTVEVGEVTEVTAPRRKPRPHSTGGHPSYNHGPVIPVRPNSNTATNRSNSAASNHSRDPRRHGTHDTHLPHPPPDKSGHSAGGLHSYNHGPVVPVRPNSNTAHPTHDPKVHPTHDPKHSPAVGGVTEVTAPRRARGPRHNAGGRDKYNHGPVTPVTPHWPARNDGDEDPNRPIIPRRLRKSPRKNTTPMFGPIPKKHIAKE